MGEDQHKPVDIELRRALHRSREYIESMRDGCSMVDADGVHVYVNSALCAMTGFSEEELLGVGPPHPYWPPEHIDDLRRSFGEVLKGNVGDVENTFMRKDGTRFPVQITPSKTVDDDGNVIGFQASVKDVSERVREVGLLRASEEKNRRASSNPL